MIGIQLSDSFGNTFFYQAQTDYELYLQRRSCDLELKTKNGSLFVHSRVFKKIESPSFHIMASQQIDFNLDVVENFVKFVYLGEGVFDESYSFMSILKLYHFAETYDIRNLIDCTIDLIKKRRLEMDAAEKVFLCELAYEYCSKDLKNIE